MPKRNVKKTNPSKGDVKANECENGEGLYKDINLLKADAITGVLLAILSIIVIIGGIRMPINMAGSENLWYTAPGSFPICIGSVVLLLSLFLIVRSIRKCGKIGKSDVQKCLLFLKGSYVRRLFVAIALLAVYVFILLGRANFVLCTFIYVMANMIIFRKPNYPIWILAVASIITTLLISYGFGTLAKIPLP